MSSYTKARIKSFRLGYMCAFIEGLDFNLIGDFFACLFGSGMDNRCSKEQPEPESEGESAEKPTIDE